MKRTLAVFFAGLSFLALFSPPSLRAETDRFSVYHSWPSIGERYFFSLSSSEGLYGGRFSVEMSNSFANRSLDLVDAGGTFVRDVVEFYLGHTLAAGYGITDWWQVGAEASFFSAASFEDPAPVASPGADEVSDFGDIRFSTKLGILNHNRHRVGLAVEPFVTASAGDQSHFLANTGATGGGNLIADVWISRRFLAALDLGAEFRQEAVSVNNINFHHRFLSGLGLWADLGRDFSALAELHAATPLNDFFSNRAATPVDYLGGARKTFGDSGMALEAGGGSCLICGAGAPRIFGYLNIGYEFQNKTLREKKALALSERRAMLQGKKIEPPPGRFLETAEPVHFDFNKTTLKAEGAKSLDLLADTLASRKEIHTVEVIGHADSVGTNAVNNAISFKRARVVVGYLRKKGVLPSVGLIPKGVGEKEPVSDNQTPQGRAANRRVVFKIID